MQSCRTNRTPSGFNAYTVVHFRTTMNSGFPLPRVARLTAAEKVPITIHTEGASLLRVQLLRPPLLLLLLLPLYCCCSHSRIVAAADDLTAGNTASRTATATSRLQEDRGRS